MKIRIYSDIHLEFCAFAPPKLEADVVVLAGDIGVGAKAITWAGCAFPDTPVIYVVGNHEFYGSSVEATWEDLRRVCPPNVHLLENESVVIDDMRFLGCTLWTDYALFGTYTQLGAMDEAAGSMSDHIRISTRAGRSKRPFEPRDALATHVRSRRWLEEELATGQATNTVVVTHHAPHRNSIAPDYATDLLSAAYASDLGHLMGKSGLWIHGHMHKSFDYRVDGTRVVCNPRGYRLSHGEMENRDFDPGLVVEV
ncbi:serine/threonine protein phosphatase [Chitinimonas prasina]|uniref:Serine/threonine protein phosphatase n=1 Tax=Chitinimonas prasina TaxID=1434937 RepID=A0ABQ5YP29_9NEIS|nr:metallophosphoesterase [Chitinimonas prasina]GLR15145.1 serine/threonine protein phosphatase [Chitinimonas prasina]